MKPTRPTIEGLTADYAEINESFDAATDSAGRLEAVHKWDRVRRSYTTWSSITHLKFTQNTKDEAAKAEREYSDELSPKVTELDINMMTVSKAYARLEAEGVVERDRGLGMRVTTMGRGPDADPLFFRAVAAAGALGAQFMV